MLKRSSSKIVVDVIFKFSGVDVSRDSVTIPLDFEVKVVGGSSSTGEFRASSFVFGQKICRLGRSCLEYGLELKRMIRWMAKNFSGAKKSILVSKQVYYRSRGLNGPRFPSPRASKSRTRLTYRRRLRSVGNTYPRDPILERKVEIPRFRYHFSAVFGDIIAGIGRRGAKFFLSPRKTSFPL